MFSADFNSYLLNMNFPYGQKFLRRAIFGDSFLFMAPIQKMGSIAFQNSGQTEYLDTLDFICVASILNKKC